MIRAGEMRVWKPKCHLNGEVYEDQAHSWYGKTVKVLYVEERSTWRICKIKPTITPKVNNPKTFEFWADEEELESQ